MGFLKCGNENECCCFCKLSVGVKCLGGWLIFEAIIQLLTIASEESTLEAFFNVINFILSLISVAMFIWSMCKVEEVRPRDYWLKAFLLEFAVGLVSLIHLLIYYNVSDHNH